MCVPDVAVPILATAPLGTDAVPALKNDSIIELPENEPVAQVIMVAIGSINPLEELLISPLPKPLVPIQPR